MSEGERKGRSVWVGHKHVREEVRLLRASRKRAGRRRDRRKRMQAEGRPRQGEGRV